MTIKFIDNLYQNFNLNYPFTKSIKRFKTYFSVSSTSQISNIDSPQKIICDTIENCSLWHAI